MYNLDRKKYILEQSQSKLCLCDSIENIDLPQIDITKFDFTNEEDFSCATVTADSPVCILYTSGTTGNPKGVEIINRNIIKLVTNIISIPHVRL